MKPRHVPMRTCVVCREKQPKADLLRIVRTVEGEVAADPGGRANGRGAYVCSGSESHWGDSQIQARLGRALKLTLKEEDIERLGTVAASPEARPAGSAQ